MRETQKKNGAAGSLVSLFSGAMGLDLGLEAAGFELRAAVENNGAARETIKLNRPSLPILQDVREISPEDLLQSAGVKKNDLTVLSGGPCCQSFSTVGKRHSFDDPRGNLFLDFCRLIKGMNPRFFVMENVPGILSAAIRHRPLNRRGPGFPPLSSEELFGSAFDQVRQSFASLGYYVIFGLVNAANYGVPQKRERIVFIGSRDGEAIYLPKPTHRDPSLENHHDLADWITLRSALQGIESKHWFEFSDERKKYLRTLKAGQNWRQLDPKLQKQALGGAYFSWGGRSGFCRRLSWDEPSPTLTTTPDGRATTLCHPRALRPLSVEEYAALQQFPRGWQFAGSIRQRYMLIGNAVPFGLGKSIGLMLRTVIESEIAPQERLLGAVVSGDENLTRRMEKRKLTMLNPTRMRRYKKPESARQWLKASGAYENTKSNDPGRTSLS